MIGFLFARFAEPQHYRFIFAFIAALIICILSLPMPCGAATDNEPGRPSITDLSIEQLMEVEVDTVYSASKFEQKITEAPSSVSIVTDGHTKVRLPDPGGHTARRERLLHKL